MLIVFSSGHYWYCKTKKNDIWAQKAFFLIDLHTKNKLSINLQDASELKLEVKLRCLIFLVSCAITGELLHAALLDMRGLGQNSAAVRKDLFFMFSFIHPVQIKLILTKLTHTHLFSAELCAVGRSPRKNTACGAVCVSFSAALVEGSKSHPCSLNRKRVDRRGSSESLQIGRASEAGDLHPAPSVSIHISILADLPRRTCQKIKVRRRPAGSS